jgi:hypothetical protein
VASPKRTLKVEILGDSRKAIGALDSLSRSAERSGGVLKTALGTGLGFLSGQAIVGGLRAISSGIGSISSTVVDMNSTLETSTLQFETLTGSADKAQEIVAGLFEFAKTTPFETGPIIDASRLLQTFGGDALNTQENLKLVGDAAAASGAGIDDLGFWVGRLYSNLQAGKPFGEAAARLQELAVLSPQARSEMEELQKAGADASEIYAVLEADFGRFDGAMIKQAGTWKGLTSTLKDTTGILLAETFKPFFDSAKEGLGAMISLMGSDGVQARAAAFGEKLSKLGENLQSVIGYFRFFVESGDHMNDFLSELDGPLRTVTEAVGLFFHAWTSSFDDFRNTGDGMIGWFAGWINVLRTGEESFGTFVGSLVTKFGPMISEFVGGMVSKLGEILPEINAKVTEWGLALINWIGPRLPELIGKLAEFAESLFGWAVDTLLPGLVERVTQWGGALIKWVVEALPGLISNLGDLVTSVLGKLADALPELGAKLGEWGKEMIGWLIPRIPGLLANLVEFVAKIGWWIITKGVPKVIEFAWNLGSGLISGILDGLAGLADKIGDFLREKIQAGIDAVKSFFGIGSPSRYTAKVIGRPLMEGIAEGILGAADLPSNALNTALSGFGSDVAIPGASGTFTGLSGARGGPSTVIIPIELDGREIGEYTVDLIAGEIRRTSRTL